MSKELIERLREAAEFLGGHYGEFMSQAADALEAKAAPVGEREAYEAWKLSMKPYGFDGFDAYQAGAAYQRAQQPQSAEAVAMLCEDVSEFGSVEYFEILKRIEPGTKLYTTPQPSAGVVMLDGLAKAISDVCDVLENGCPHWAAQQLRDEFARLNGKEVGRG